MQQPSQIGQSEQVKCAQPERENELIAKVEEVGVTSSHPHHATIIASPARTRRRIGHGSLSYLKGATDMSRSNHTLIIGRTQDCVREAVCAEVCAQRGAQKDVRTKGAQQDINQTITQ